MVSGTMRRLKYRLSDFHWPGARRKANAGAGGGTSVGVISWSLREGRNDGTERRTTEPQILPIYQYRHTRIYRVFKSFLFIAMN